MKEPDRVFAQMWGPFREQLIANHQFYVTEAKKRLLAQFEEESIKADADRYAEEWLASVPFDPDRDDPAGAYEQAWEENISFYQSLTELRDNTRLSIIAGMYHEWEKQLRDWLGIELGHHRLGKQVNDAIWSVSLENLIDFFESWNWSIRDQGYWTELKIFQLVVNVYKHGNGRSFAELRDLEPKLVGAKEDIPGFFLSALNYSNLSIGDQEIDRLSEAIVAFWHDVPENTYFSQIKSPPVWLEKAIRKDQAAKGANE